MPCFCPWVGGVNTDVDHLRDFETPIAHDLESFAIPCRISNDVDGHRYVERASEFQCFEIFRKRHAFAVAFQSFFVDCFKAEEHRIHTEPLPEPEDLLVTQQHVATRFEVITFADPAPGNGFAKLHAVLGLNESYVVHDKNAGLAYLRQLLNGALGCLYAIVTSVKCPRAAKDAVPWAASTELDGSRRV